MKKKPNRRPLIYLGLGLIGVFIIFVLAVFVMGSMLSDSYGKSVAVVKIDFPLTVSGVQPTLFSEGVPSAKDVADKIDKLNKRKDIGAIVLDIDCPGGSVVATHEIYNSLEKSKKPIVVYMREMATSGAYYISMPAKRIYADPDTITGNIGALFESVNLRGLMDKTGLKFVVIKSGPNKDMGNPAKNLTIEQQAILQGIVNETYTEFKNVVLKHRGNKLKGNMSILFDGRIFSGRQAQKLGLVDKLGTMDDAEDYAGKLANITGKPNVVDENFGQTPSIINVNSFIKSMNMKGEIYGISYR